MSTPENARPTQAPEGKFTTGSTMRHVLVMSATSWLGLVAIFLVDFLNLFYISWLGRQELTAAIGYSGALIFVLISFGIGTTIAGTALTARAIGARRPDEARQMAASSLVISALTQGVPAVLMAVFARDLLAAMGATGEALEVATGFLHIVLPGMPLMGIGMTLAGVLRAVGDARRAMNVTLVGAISTAILDPLFIFGLGLGVTGAAIVTVLSRVVFVLVGWHGAVRVHNLVGRPSWAHMMQDIRPLMAIGVPAVLTNLATPVGSIFTTRITAGFGDAAVAGAAVMDRLVPLAFGGVFALTGAIGPILGQNLGAKRYDRLRGAVNDSLKLTVIYCLVVWALLAILAPVIVSAFQVKGLGIDIVVFFCHVTTGTFLFTGLMFVANTVFNNLGFPVLSTVFNWGRATLGTIPLVLVGAHYWGVIGISAGWGIGAIVFGLAAIVWCYRVLDTIEARDRAGAN